MKMAYISIFAICLVLMSGVPFMIGGGSNAYARFASTKTQSQANTNNCNNGTNCALTSPQTQGDGSASSPTSSQISNLKGELQDLVSSVKTFNFDLANCHVEPSAFNCQITNYVRGSYLICLDNPFRCNVHIILEIKFPVECIVDSRDNPTKAECHDPAST
jgi:hypothetical protein